MMRIASILVSGKAALQANSERHFTASWKESMVAAKCCLKIRSVCTCVSVCVWGRGDGGDVEEVERFSA